MKEIRIGKNIWPDIDDNKSVNKFLKRFGIELDFLLDDGLCFKYPEDTIEPYYSTGDSLYFRDTSSKKCLLHYYEDFGELVFEEEGKDNVFKIPILEDYDI